jgi:hypothetical protein
MPPRPAAIQHLVSRAEARVSARAAGDPRDAGRRLRSPDERSRASDRSPRPGVRRDGRERRSLPGDRARESCRYRRTGRGARARRLRTTVRRRHAPAGATPCRASACVRLSGTRHRRWSRCVGVRCSAGAGAARQDAATRSSSERPRRCAGAGAPPRCPRMPTPGRLGRLLRARPSTCYDMRRHRGCKSARHPRCRAVGCRRECVTEGRCVHRPRGAAV